MTLSVVIVSISVLVILVWVGVRRRRRAKIDIGRTKVSSEAGTLVHVIRTDQELQPVLEAAARSERRTAEAALARAQRYESRLNPTRVSGLRRVEDREDARFDGRSNVSDLSERTGHSDRTGHSA
jgi:hypothetical protein